jgi:hypothetical protein
MHACYCVYMLLTFLSLSLVCAKGVHFMSGHMKFVCFRGGGWWDSWYKAAKDKVFILCFMFLCISASKQECVLCYNVCVLRHKECTGM